MVCGIMGCFSLHGEPISTVGSGSGERKYDLVVIGGGAAGFAAIVKYRELLGYDRKIAMVTRGRFSADGGS
jgi:hypothetical protein